MNERLMNFLVQRDIPFEEMVDMRKRTWIHRGGVASVYIVPNSALQLESIARYLYVEKISFLVVGHTSNLYIRNSTDIEVVVSTIHCNKYSLVDEYIECECGVSVEKLSKHMVNEGVSGFEYLTELPGTIGGAIYNNSSCKNNSISALLLDMKFVKNNGEIVILNPEELHYEFRTSDLKKHVLEGTIISVRLRVVPGSKDELQRIAEENVIERKKILDGPSKNLGCTVNRMFSSGIMPPKYRIPCMIFSKVMSMFIHDELRRKRLYKNFLLLISGYRNLQPYVSDKQLIVFVWKDDRADLHFNDYLKFMMDVCGTDKVEIEIM